MASAPNVEEILSFMGLGREEVRTDAGVTQRNNAKDAIEILISKGQTAAQIQQIYSAAIVDGADAAIAAVVNAATAAASTPGSTPTPVPTAPPASSEAELEAEAVQALIDGTNFDDPVSVGLLRRNLADIGFDAQAIEGIIAKQTAGGDSGIIAVGGKLVRENEDGTFTTVYDPNPVTAPRTTVSPDVAAQQAAANQRAALNAGVSGFGSLVDSLAPLAQAGTAANRLQADILARPADFATRALQIRGGTPDFAETTQADLINRLGGFMRAINEQLAGFQQRPVTGFGISGPPVVPPPATASRTTVPPPATASRTTVPSDGTSEWDAEGQRDIMEQRAAGAYDGIPSWARADWMIPRTPAEIAAAEAAAAEAAAFDQEQRDREEASRPPFVATSPVATPPVATPPVVTPPVVTPTPEPVLSNIIGPSGADEIIQPVLTASKIHEPNLNMDRFIGQVTPGPSDPFTDAIAAIVRGDIPAPSGMTAAQLLDIERAKAGLPVGADDASRDQLSRLNPEVFASPGPLDPQSEAVANILRGISPASSGMTASQLLDLERAKAGLPIGAEDVSRDAISRIDPAAFTEPSVISPAELKATLGGVPAPIAEGSVPAESVYGRPGAGVTGDETTLEHGGFANRAIVGDSSDGKENPELVEALPGGGFRVTPVDKKRISKRVSRAQDGGTFGDLGLLGTLPGVPEIDTVTQDQIQESALGVAQGTGFGDIFAGQRPAPLQFGHVGGGFKLPTAIGLGSLTPDERTAFGSLLATRNTSLGDVETAVRQRFARPNTRPLATLRSRGF